MKQSRTEVLSRVVDRDAGWMGSRQEVRSRYERRYIPGQELYFAEAKPQEAADLLIDNSNFEHPLLLRGPADFSWSRWY